MGGKRGRDREKHHAKFQIGLPLLPLRGAVLTDKKKIQTIEERNINFVGCNNKIMIVLK